jgi:hypothetical protein
LQSIIWQLRGSLIVVHAQGERKQNGHNPDAASGCGVWRTVTPRRLKSNEQLSKQSQRSKTQNPKCILPPGPEVGEDHVATEFPFLSVFASGPGATAPKRSAATMHKLGGSEVGLKRSKSRFVCAKQVGEKPVSPLPAGLSPAEDRLLLFRERHIFRRNRSYDRNESSVG